MKTSIRNRLAVFAVVLGSGLSPHLAVADAAPSLPPDASLDALLAWADQNGPMTAAMRAEAEARAQQESIAGTLENPMFAVEWRDIDRSSPTLSPTGVGSMKYTVSQSLPPWGARAIRNRVAQAATAEATSRAAVTRAEVRAGVRRAWAMLYQVHDGEIINRDIDALLLQMEFAARLRYQNGMASQADVIRLQTERSMLQNEQLQLAGEKQRARAQLAAWLNIATHNLIDGPVVLPAMPPQLDRAVWLDKAVAGNPTLQAAQRALDGAEAQRDLAGLNTRPGVTVGLSAIQMESRLTMYELMLEVEVPLQGVRRRAERAEAAAMLSAARLRAASQLRDVQREIEELITMFDTSMAQKQLLDSTLFPQAELVFQSSLAAYQAGKGEFAALLEAQQQLRRLRQMRLMSDIEQFQAWTGLLMLTGEP